MRYGQYTCRGLVQLLARAATAPCRRGGARPEPAAQALGRGGHAAVWHLPPGGANHDRSRGPQAGGERDRAAAATAGEVRAGRNGRRVTAGGTASQGQAVNWRDGRSSPVKRAVSVSLGSPGRDSSGVIPLLGEYVQIERHGSGGSIETARQLIRELDGKVDALGLGGTDIYLQAAGRRYYLRDGVRLAREAGTTPIVCGAGLKDSLDRKSTRLNSSHVAISYAVFCLK